MTLSSRGAWLEPQLRAGMPCQVPVWAAALSKGSPRFFPRRSGTDAGRDEFLGTPDLC